MISAFDFPLGLKSEPPLPPPIGNVVSEFLNVCSKAKNLRIEFGGSLIRPEATGYGNVYFLLQMLKTRNIDIKDKVVCVSGSGNVAQYTVEKLISLGAKVVTMSDSDGYIYDPDGIDREKLDYIMELKNLYRGRIREYAEQYGCKYVQGARPWGEKCDIAMPSATQNELNGDDAKTLLANGCFAVSEGANMPSTPEAIDAFLEAKILYAPGKPFPRKCFAI